MRKIVLSSPPVAGEDLLCWVLAQLTGLVPFQMDSAALHADQPGEDWFAEGQFVVGHIIPTGSAAAWLSEERVRPIFLVRNIYDLLIDQFRNDAAGGGSLGQDCADGALISEGIASLISGGVFGGHSYPGLGAWSHQMQEMLSFSMQHPSYVVSYEKLLQDPAQVIRQLARFLSLRRTAKLVGELASELSLEIQARVGSNAAAPTGYRYSLPAEHVGLLTNLHSQMIRRVLTTQAPDLGAVSATLGFPEITAIAPALLEARLGRVLVSTVFKSGTKLLEHIVARLTGLKANGPGMEVGSDYESDAPICFESGKFFIWHNVPSDAVKARLRAECARPIFLIRNIYDLVVSQYFHFANDVDAAIGHGTGTAGYFARMGRDEGLSLILCGGTSEHFHWHGFGYYLRQTQEILKFARKYPSHVVVYDRLVLDKQREIERLAGFLEIDVSAAVLDELLGTSTLEAMREARVVSSGSGAHFRKGLPGEHVNVLKPYHYHMINHLKLAFAPELDALCEELRLGDITSAPPEPSKPIVTDAPLSLRTSGADDGVGSY